MNQKEIAWVQHAQQGSLSDYEQLWDQYSQEVYQQICLTIRNSKEAKNLLLSSFVTAGQNLNKLTDPSAFRVWLHWIARRQCRQYFEKNTYAFEQEEDDLPYVSLTMLNSELYVPTVYADDEEKRKALGKIIAGLSDIQREAVALYYFGQMEIDEVAGVLEMSKKDLKTILYMARCEIRDALEAEEAEKGEKLMGVDGVDSSSLQEILPEVGESMALSEATSASIRSRLGSLLREEELGDDSEDDSEDADDSSSRRSRRGWMKREPKAPKEPKTPRAPREPKEKKERKPLHLPQLSPKTIRLGLMIGIPALLVIGVIIFFLVRGGISVPGNDSDPAQNSSQISGQNPEMGDSGKLSEKDAQNFYTSTITKLSTDLAYDGVISSASKLLTGSAIPDYYTIRCLQEAYNRVASEKLNLVLTVEEDGYPSELSGSEKKAVEKKASLVDENRGYAYCSLKDLQKALDAFFGPGTVKTSQWAQKTDASNNQLPYVASGYLFYANSIDIEADGALYYSLFGVAADSQTPSITIKALRRDNYLTLKDAASGHSYYNADPEAAASESRLYDYYLRNGNEGNIFSSLTREFEINDYFLETIEISLKKENGQVYITGVDYPKRGDYYVNTDWLRIRSIPSTDGEILGYANENEYLTILTKEKGENDTTWGKVTYQGEEGYVSMDYVEKESAGHEMEVEKNRWDQLQASIQRRKDVRRSGDRFENPETVDPSGNNSGPSGNNPGSTGNNSGSPQAEFSRIEAPTSFTETIDVLAGGTYQVNTDEGMNVRIGPSSDYEKIGSLNAEDIVEIFEILVTENGQWGRVVSEEGNVGYVFMEYMKLV